MPLLVLFIATLLFNRQLFDGNHVIPWDFRFWHLPHAVFIADALRDGEFPLWNPYIYCGMPFAANPQVALFYPFRLLTILIAVLLRSADLIYYLEADWMLSMFLGGVFTYYLARELKQDKISALFAAGTYQLGAFFASQSEHLGAIEIAAWLPLVWLGILKLKTRVYILPAALAMCILGGFTPLTVVVFLSAAILCLIERAPVLRAIFSFAFSMLLAAAIVFPAAQLRALSVSRFRTDWMGTGGGRPLESLATLIYPNAFHILEPGAFSGKGDLTFFYTYCGILGLSFALFALTRATTPRAFKYLFPISAVLMLGDSTILGKLFFQALPGVLKDPYYPQQWLAPFTLSLALLSGAGLAAILETHRAAAIALPLAIVDLLYCNSARPMNTTTLTREPAVTKTSFVGDQQLLDDVRRATLPNRIDTKGASIHWTDSAMITGVPTANGQDPMALIGYMQVRDIFCNGQRWGVYYQVADTTSPVLSFLNVSTIVTPTNLIKNESVLPRFYLVKETRQVTSPIAELQKTDWNPREIAFIEGASYPSSTEGHVTVIEYRRNTINLTVDTPKPAFLVTSEPNYPGWTATIDGANTPIQTTNVAFRGLPVPPGTHHIQFHFAPELLYWSIGVSLVSWLVMASYVLRQK